MTPTTTSKERKIDSTEVGLVIDWVDCATAIWLNKSKAALRNPLLYKKFYLSFLILSI